MRAWSGHNLVRSESLSDLRTPYASTLVRAAKSAVVAKMTAKAGAQTRAFTRPEQNIAADALIVRGLVTGKKITARSTGLTTQNAVHFGGSAEKRNCGHDPAIIVFIGPIISRNLACGHTSTGNVTWQNYGKESSYVHALRMCLSFALTKDLISTLVTAFIFDSSIHQI